MNKVLIYGGLGNQMFQYALNIALNEKGNKSKILFTNFFYNQHHNGFNLSRAFKIRLPFPLNVYDFLLSYGEIVFRNKKVSYLLQKLITRHHKKKYISYREEEEFIYDEKIFNKTSNLFVGIWQVEAYFKDYKDIVSREFVFKYPKDKKNKNLIEEINARNSISIHVRKGDYNSSAWSKTHDVIKDKTYYINAINYLNEKIQDPHYYIFSDDIPWVKENLEFPGCTFVDHNKGKNAYIDMYLMSLCKHNIIANSTFSWWGAWLNPNKDKVVIAPKKWLNSSEIIVKDLIPDSWIKL